MCRRFATSLLFLAGLLAVAVAQPPGTDKQPDPMGKAGGKTGGKQSADPLAGFMEQMAGNKNAPNKSADAAVAAALVNDPDVKVARAKVQLAEAELTKAKQAVVMKVLTLKASISEHESAVRSMQDRVAWAERLVDKGQMTQAQLLDDRAKLGSAQAALAKAETELKLLTGSDRLGPVADLIDVTDPNQAAVESGLKWLAAQQRLEQRDYATRMYLAQLALGESIDKLAVKGPVPDRIRAALDKPVKLGAKGEKVTFEKALEVFKKDAGLDVPVRGAFPTRAVVEFDPIRNPTGPPPQAQARPIEVVSEGEELPVGAWFQLFEDNAAFVSGGVTRRFRFYVREYGLFLASGDLAPPDAPTLIEFWKQKPAAKKETTAEPKPK